MKCIYGDYKTIHIVHFFSVSENAYSTHEPGNEPVILHFANTLVGPDSGSHRPSHTGSRLWISAAPSLDRPCTFHRERGTLQGDVSSPHNWVRFFDMAPRALHLDRQAHTSPASGAVFLARGPDGIPFAVGDMGYADDLVSTASTLSGLQRQADVFLALARCVDIEI